MSDAYVRSCHNGKLLAARSIIDFYGGDGSFDTFSARTRDYIVATTPTNLLDWWSAWCFDVVVCTENLIRVDEAMELPKLAG
jgi:hypothetical protein